MVKSNAVDIFFMADPLAMWSVEGEMWSFYALDTHNLKNTDGCLGSWELGVALDNYNLKNTDA